jgi:FdhD protein
MIEQARGMKYDSGAWDHVTDSLSVEAPLQVSINSEPFTMTMRTPGHDRELARGLVHTEAIIGEDVPDISYHESINPDSGYIDTINLNLPETFILKDFTDNRSMLSNSSCGMCGKRELYDMDMKGDPILHPPPTPLDMNLLPSMMEQMAERQESFEHSGGCHCASSFSSDGKLLTAFEDVGRHNAVDKVIGSLLVDGRLDEAACLLVSGRVSFEIVSKAYRGRIPIIIAVSAPSSMAVDTADLLGMTIIAFCRGKRATVYSNISNVKCRAEEGNQTG